MLHLPGKRAQTLTNPAVVTAAAPNPQQQVPSVAILPSQAQQQQPTQVLANELVVSAATSGTATPSLVSPVESPRRSIILQPPMADALQQAPSFIFAQVGRKLSIGLQSL